MAQNLSEYDLDRSMGCQTLSHAQQSGSLSPGQMNHRAMGFDFDDGQYAAGIKCQQVDLNMRDVNVVIKYAPTLRL